MKRLMARTIWLGMQVEHPAEWEPSRLGTDASHGRCVLVDGVGERLDVQWRQSKAMPDLRRMFRDYRKSADLSGGGGELRLEGWEGFVREGGGGCVTQAGRYFERAGRLVELAIAWPRGRDKALERRILAGLSPQAVCEKRVWQALGLSTAVPANWGLGGYSARAGHVWFDFKSKDESLRINRLSMAGDWMKVSLREWLAARVPDGVAGMDWGVSEINGHERISCGGVGGGSIWNRLRGRRLWREWSGWRCESSGRVFLLEWSAVGGEKRAMDSVEVGCCAPLANCGGAARV